MFVDWCCSSVAEHWQLKPEALGSILGGTTFLSFPLPFQRSLDSNRPEYLLLDDLYRSSDLGEPRPSGSSCCDIIQILSNSRHTHTHTHTHSNYHPSNNMILGWHSLTHFYPPFSQSMLSAHWKVVLATPDYVI